MSGCLVLGSRTALAQWVTQQITLKAGWNAVYLQVLPAEPTCKVCFGSLPMIESVWKYNRRFTTVQFDENPMALLADPDRWLTWLPASHPEAFLSTLHGLQGGEAYLIKVSASAAPFVWAVKGAPVLPATEWVPNALNLAGLPVDPAAGPSFAQLLRDTPEINTAPGAGSGIYGVSSDGREYQIRQTERTLVQPGAAYWVRLRQFTRHPLPVVIEGSSGSRGSIDFGRDAKEATATLRNVTLSTPITLTLRLLPSEAAPPGSAEVAGLVPLAYFVSSIFTNEFGWRKFPDELPVTLAPGETKELRLGVSRAAMLPYTPAGTNGAVYCSLLEAREGPHGILLLLPITAESEKVRRVGVQSLTSVEGTNQLGGLSDLPAYSLNQGLWVGQVQLTQVSRPFYNTNLAKDPNALLPASSPLNTRLLVHVDSSGNASLLQRVMLAWEGVSTNGQYQLYRDESGVPASDKEVYRLSSVTLPIMPPAPLAGLFGDTLTTQVNLDYDDPVNPFKHVFHPDHDNLDELFSTNKLPPGLESFNVSRDILLNYYVTHKNDQGRFMPPGAVLAFDGKQAHVKVDPVTLGSSFTVMAWVRANPADGQGRYVLSFSNGTNDGLFLKLEGDTGKMTFGCTTTEKTYLLTSTNAFPSNQWVHVTMVNDGAGTGEIYWDAQLAAEGDMGPPNGLTRTNIYFGRGPIEGAGYLAGKMYDLTIWGDARTEAEVYSDMFLSLSLNENNLVAYFKANEGQGTTMADEGGSPLSATLVGTAWDDAEAFRSTPWGIGEADGAYSETLRGVRPQPILLQGTFHLERVSREAVLH